MLSGCVPSNDKLKNKCTGVQQIKVKSIIQMPGSNGKILSDTGFYSRYSNQNMELYKIPYFFEAPGGDSDSKLSLKYWYVIYQKGATYGYTFDTVQTANNNKRVKIDSVLAKWTLSQLELPLDSNKLTLVSTEAGSKAGVFSETYAGKPPFLNDTMHYYYNNNLKNIDYSLSSRIDSIKNSRLFKLKIISYSGPRDSSIKTNRREYEYEMLIPDSIEDCRFALSLFEKFKNK
jgi:hypothetical protein